MTLTNPPSEIHFGYSQKKKKKDRDTRLRALGLWQLCVGQRASITSY